MLCAHHRADPAAAGVTALVANGSKADAVLSGLANGCHADLCVMELLTQRSLGFARALAPQVGGISELNSGVDIVPTC